MDGKQVASGLTDQQLQAIEERWAKATPGPWYSHYGEYDDGEQGPQWSGEMGIWPKGADRSRRSDVLNLPIANVGYHGSGESDAAAIASAPTDISLLLAEVRRLQLAEKVCKLMQKNMGGHYCVVSKCDECHTETVGNAGEVCWTCIDKALKEWEAAGNG